MAGLNEFQAKLQNAMQRAVPLVGVTTQDQPATIKLILASLPQDMVMLTWDIVDGLKGYGVPGEDFAEIFYERLKEPEILSGKDGFRELIVKLKEIIPNVRENRNVFCLVAQNLHRGLDDSSIIQTIAGCRGWLAEGGTLNGVGRSSCLIMLGPSFSWPAELSQDIYSLADEPPKEARIREIIKDVCEWATVPLPEEKQLAKGAESLLSLSEFSVQQEVALAVSKKEGWIEKLGEKRKMRVDATPGLGMFGGRTNFADVGGYEEAKAFLRKLFAGPLGLRTIFFWDEIEKQLGSPNDSTGVSLRMLGTLLSHMSDNGVSGILFHGVPGSGKTAISQACAREFDIPFVSADLSAMQNSLVGRSEENLRRALEIDKSLGGGKSLWIATCNEINRIPSPLLRRFDLATFTFDIPSPAEQETIWPILIKKYGLDERQEKPENVEGWTGSDIEKCCKMAFALSIPLKEAAKYVIPLAISRPEIIEQCHQEAAGKLLSASYPGPFKTPEKEMKKGRAMQVGGTTNEVFEANFNRFQFFPVERGGEEEETKKIKPKPKIGFGE